jgi:thiol-disulfide isomerase/thioredoxin
MSDDTGSRDPASDAATTSVPSGRRGLIRSIVHRLAGEEVALPVEGRLPSFEGATGWLNSDPLTPEGLRGRVVLVDFWTYTCVNWLRTLPYLRAWAAKYGDDDLTVIGVHTPEFGFEGNIDNVIAQSARLGVEYPIAVDSGYGVWRAFANHFWPALYIADEEGRIRFHHFGEGEYPMTEMVIQRLLVGGGAAGVDQDLVMVEPRGLEVAADWRTLQSPETYVGYRQRGRSWERRGPGRQRDGERPTHLSTDPPTRIYCRPPLRGRVPGRGRRGVLLHLRLILDR